MKYPIIFEHLIDGELCFDCAVESVREEESSDIKAFCLIDSSESDNDMQSFFCGRCGDVLI